VQTAPAPAHAWPGGLTVGERAAVAAALRSPDVRTHRVAIDVATAEAGSLALAEPSALHHHGLHAAAARQGDGAQGLDRFPTDDCAAHRKIAAASVIADAATKLRR
jgi:hypothetical protein